MKKILLPLFLIICLNSITRAQVSLGVQGGANLSTLQGEAIQSLNNLVELTNGMVTRQLKPGVAGRIYTTIPLQSAFALETGLSYQQKGYKLTGNFNSSFFKLLNTRADIINTSQYAGIDVLAKAGITKGLSLKAGPQISYLVKNNLNLRSGLLGFNLLNENFDLTANTNRWDIGLTGGLGYKFSNGLSINGYYTQGLSRIDKNQRIKAFNQTAGITIGYEF
jgi:hypothetical protein